MQSALSNASYQNKPSVYRDQIASLKQYRAQINEAVQAHGDFAVSQHKVISSTERFNDAVRKNKIGIGDVLTGNIRENLKMMKQAQREQAALQNSMGTTWSSGTPGKSNVDLFVPRNLSASMNDIRQRYGYINQVVSSIATQTVNWGKNTQWAGRQIMVGITVPLGIAAAGMAKLTYDTDKQLTRIAKVYDLQTTAAMSSINQQSAGENELRQLREQSLNDAIQLAKDYGQSVNDTLELQANLAATGLSGDSLRNMTKEVSRIAALGELTTQQSTDMAVALKTAFRMTDEGVVHFNDFANAVENATSLSIQDIAEATPRAASALAGLGVTAEEMTVLLVSMKEAGVNAAEGANALKSATTRILRPTPQAKNIFSQYNIDLQALVDSTQGNLFKTLKKLSPAMEQMTDYQRQQAIAALFGTYQFNRLNAALANLNDTTTQAGTAMEIMGKNEEELASISAGELEKAAKSASGTFDRLVESIKGELAKMGQPLLEAINPVLSVINTMFETFNKMPDSAKKFSLIALAAVGIIGPVMMLVGVFGNLIGSFLKGAAVFSNLFLRFKMMTAEERAAAVAAKQTTNVFDTQAMSAARLEQSMKMLNAQMALYTRAQGGITPVDGPNGMSAQGQNSTMRRNSRGQIIYGAGSKDASGKAIGGRGVSAEDKARFEALENSTDDMAQNSKKFSVNMERATAAGIGLTTAAVAVSGMAGNGNKMVTDFATIATTALIIQQALSVIPFGKIATSMKTMSGAATAGVATNAGKASGIISKIGTSLKAAAPLAAGLWPVAAAAAVAFSAYELYEWSQKTRKEWDQIVNQGKTLASIVGATGEIQQVDSVTGEKKVSDLETRTKNVQALKDSNEDLFKSYKKLNDSDLYNTAVQAGLSVKFRDGTPEQVRQAMETVLAAAGKGNLEIQDIMVKINKVDFDNPEEVAALVDQSIGEALESAKTKNKDRKWWNLALNDGELTQGAAGAARTAAETFYEQFASADPGNRGALLSGLNKKLEAETAQTMANVNSIVSMNGQKVYDGPAGVIKAMREEMKKAGAASTELNNATYLRGTQLAKTLNLDTKQIEVLMNNAAMEREFAQQIARSNGMSDKQIAKIETLEDVSRDTGYAFKEAAGGNKQLEGASQAATAAMEEQQAVAADLAETMRNDIVDAMKTASSSAMDAVYSKADDMLASQQEGIIDGIKAKGDADISALEARAERANDRFEARKDAIQEETERLNDDLKKSQKQESKAFDKRWDDMMKSHEKTWDARQKTEEDAYDARIKAIEDEIEAEEKADEIRQRLFEAEITRIQRLSQMFNTNIDFNSALNSGNIDEAAKLASTAQATQLQWSVDDQRANTTSSLDQKKEALNGQKDALQKDKEARLNQLKEMQEAEKEVLDARKEQEQELLDVRQQNAQKALDVERDRMLKTLDAEKDAYNKGVSANKERLQKRTQANQDAANKEFKANKEKLDLELMQLKAFIPKDEKERQEHIKRIQSAYEKYGSGLKLSGSEWSKYIGDSLVASVDTAKVNMQEKKKWQEVGNSITDGMASAFDITGAQLMQWLKTGIYPTRTGVVGGGKPTGGKIGQTARHSGGGIGWSSKDRTGVPRSSSLYPSEYSTILKKREFVVNEKASRKHGPLLNAINSGSYHEGGMVGVTARHEGGLASIATGMAASVGKMIAYSIGQSMTSALSESAFGGMYGIAEKGKFGNTNLDDEQLRNASSIMNTGKNLGASTRDIMIALMTALQESSLRNLAGGDRDSVGLFQQRPSQGWGTVAQIRDPNYAATKFFEALFKVNNRDGLAPTVAAQKVQRSAFPNAYAKWEDEALAIMSATPIMAAVNAQLSGSVGAGGRTVELLQQMMSRSGLPYRVTSTTGGQHSQASYHYKGQAIDVAGPRPGVDTPEMAAIAQYLYRNYGNGLAELIYAGPGGIGLKNGRPFNYSNGILQSHRNHVHVAATPDSLSALRIPGLKVGGEIRYDNTLANLHKNETVLTAPLSAKLNEGINNISNAGDTNVNIDLRGAHVTQDTVQDIRKVVRDVLDQRDNRNGRSRRVG